MRACRPAAMAAALVAWAAAPCERSPAHCSACVVKLLSHVYRAGVLTSTETGVRNQPSDHEVRPALGEQVAVAGEERTGERHEGERRLDVPARGDAPPGDGD